MPDILKEEIQRYLEDYSPEVDGLIREMEDYAAENDVPIAAREVTHLQTILARAINAQQVLEIGTAIGYTAIQVARTGCQVVSLEQDPEMIQQSQKYIQSSRVGENIQVLEGNALNLLDDLNREDSSFDMVFIDAAKEEYVDYLDKSLPLLRHSGVVVVDNLLWFGQVATGAKNESYEESTEALREFNDYFTHHSDLDALILPLGDGTGLGIKN